MTLKNSLNLKRIDCLSESDVLTATFRESVLIFGTEFVIAFSTNWLRDHGWSVALLGILAHNKSVDGH